MMWDKLNWLCFGSGIFVVDSSSAAMLQLIVQNSYLFWSITLFLLCSE